jgi:hypothetical protein
MTTNDARTALEGEFAESVAELQAALKQAADANTQAAQANTQAEQANTQAAQANAQATQATTQAAEATTHAAEATAHAADATAHAADAAARVQTLIPRVGSISALFAQLDNVIRTGREQIGATAPAPAYTGPTLVVTEPEAPAPVAEQPTAPKSEITASLTSFRLEFESSPGPLDLRTVDDAVSEHPAVRDVALLDYDGRKATLKVWIEPSASPSDIQSALAEKSPAIFGSTNAVTIVALEDAA